jgi:hypothetical protein
LKQRQEEDALLEQARRIQVKSNTQHRSALISPCQPLPACCLLRPAAGCTSSHAELFGFEKLLTCLAAHAQLSYIATCQNLVPEQPQDSVCPGLPACYALYRRSGSAGLWRTGPGMRTLPGP